MPCRWMLSSAPAEQAPALAEHLVQCGAAACVSLLPGARSVYRWKGRIEQAEETLLLIKTAADTETVAEALRSRHPYELPELIAVDVSSGLPAYLEWVARHSGPAATD
ncbi:MAG: divalent cation tolerance protein [Lysobacteraceae bacterium]|nr:MAG: divalent cation tolerance protein [Xanthomonadaceae bacterium]